MKPVMSRHSEYNSMFAAYCYSYVTVGTECNPHTLHITHGHAQCSVYVLRLVLEGRLVEYSKKRTGSCYTASY